MKQKNKWYDLRSAKALFEYAEANYTLRTTDKKVYRALQSLESQQDGINKDVVANHRTIKRAAKVALGTVKTSLERMREQGLIKYKAGDTDYAKHKASRIRRKSIEELEEERRQKQPAYQLKAILNKRSIQYGDSKVTPQYSVAITNRLYASNPNVQGKKDIRADWLARGCKEGEVLFELDFVAADPSVISHKLGLEKDGYTIIAEAEGMDRDTVKGFFNAVVYSRSTAVACAKKHGVKSAEALAYFQKVDELRDQLRRPEGKPVRHVATATGTKIDMKKGDRAYKGTLLCYYAQGTIADFINEAALEIIELEKERRWKLLITCHDSVYMIAKPEHEGELVELVLARTKKVGAKIKLTPKVCNPREYQKTCASAQKPCVA